MDLPKKSDKKVNQFVKNLGRVSRSIVQNSNPFLLHRSCTSRMHWLLQWVE